MYLEYHPLLQHICITWCLVHWLHWQWNISAIRMYMVVQKINWTIYFCWSNSVFWFYTVSQKKNKQNYFFLITTSNFHQIWQLLAQRWQRV